MFKSTAISHVTLQAPLSFSFKKLGFCFGPVDVTTGMTYAKASPITLSYIYPHPSHTYVSAFQPVLIMNMQTMLIIINIL